MIKCKKRCSVPTVQIRNSDIIRAVEVTCLGEVLCTVLDSVRAVTYTRDARVSENLPSPAMGGPAMTETPRVIARRPKAFVSLSTPIFSHRMIEVSDM